MSCTHTAYHTLLSQHTVYHHIHQHNHISYLVEPPLRLISASVEHVQSLFLQPCLPSLIETLVQFSFDLYNKNPNSLLNRTNPCTHTQAPHVKHTLHRLPQALWTIPMRWARSCACKSAWGFQSESYKITVSAVCKLIPSPPARVLNKKIKTSDPSALKAWIRSSRSYTHTAIQMYVNYNYNGSDHVEEYNII